MELVVGICDDSREQIQLLKRYLYKYNYQPGVKLISSTDPYVFLTKIKDKKPLLVFLDIDMKELNGIELAERIREEAPDTIIIFITAYEEYALDAFSVRAFHYLIKPMQEESFYRVLEEALELLHRKTGNNKKRTLTIYKKGEIILLDYDEILYFEKIRHKILINCGHKKIKFYGSLKKLLQDIDYGTFIKCHQGYIINKDKVRAYKNSTLILEGDIQIPVSRSHVNEIKSMLAERLFSREE